MTPRLIDIHAHVNFVDFGDDYREIIEKTLAENVWLINIGADLETSKKSVEILADFPVGVFASVGFHPTEVGELSPADWAELKRLASLDRVVAIGECGLEYFERKSNVESQMSEVDGGIDKERQKKIFRQQIEIALEVDKPLMIHCRTTLKSPTETGRDAYEDTISILKEYKEKYGDRLRGNVHFFAGNLEQAKKLVNLGFSLSFTGVITFTDQYEEIIKWLPEEAIMAETDAPYVAPVPYRGKRNEPLYVEEVVKKMAQLRGVSYEEMARLTVGNSRRLFGI